MYRRLKKTILQSLSKLKSKDIQALLCLDFILLPLALYTSVLLRLGGVWDHQLDSHIWIFLALPLWTIPIFIYTGLYKAVIKYFDEKIVSIVLAGVSFSVLILSCLILFCKIYAWSVVSG